MAKEKSLLPPPVPPVLFAVPWLPIKEGNWFTAA